MKLITSFLLFILFSALAHAHTVGGTGFLAGLAHPVLGFDHFLAMVSVGIWSAQLGGRFIWSVPTTFVSFMIIGAIMGMMGIDLPLIEVGIAISVMLLGIAIAGEKFFSPKIGSLFVAIFGIFHGHAHGVEMPTIANPYLYALGFVLGTSFIHLLGVFLGIMAQKSNKSASCLRYIGAGIAGIGLHIFITYIPLIWVMLHI